MTIAPFQIADVTRFPGAMLTLAAHHRDSPTRVIGEGGHA
jgi:hypothetical protein